MENNHEAIKWVQLNISSYRLVEFNKFKQKMWYKLSAWLIILIYWSHWAILAYVQVPRPRYSKFEDNSISGDNAKKYQQLSSRNSFINFVCFNQSMMDTLWYIHAFVDEKRELLLMLKIGQCHEMHKDVVTAIQKMPLTSNYFDIKLSLS